MLEDLWEDLQQNHDWPRKLAARRRESAAAAATREAEARAVWATMPDVGPVTIETLLAEPGDWERFHCADAVVSFAGLA